MKKLLCVILLVVALAATANAGDLIVGATFGPNTDLTTFEYRLDQSYKGAWGNELVFGVATGFDQLNQNTDVNKYSVGLGWNATNGNATIAGGPVISYIDAVGVNNAYAGVYGSVDLKISKSWLAQVKYTEIFGVDIAEGWQAGIGLRF